MSSKKSDQTEPARKPGRPSKYTEETKALARQMYDTFGGTQLSVIAVELGVPISTIHGWVQDVAPAKGKSKEQKAEILADKFELVAHRLVDHMLDDDEHLRRASLSQIATAAAIAIDKMRLLRGMDALEKGQTLSIEQLNVLVNQGVSASSPPPAIEAEIISTTENPQ